MELKPFLMERTQSVWENKVDINLSESGVLPLTLEELVGETDINKIELSYPQTNGTEALRESITELYPGTDIENVLVTNGIAEANYISVLGLLQPGDEVIVMYPNYMQIWGLAESLGASVKPLVLHEADDWAIDPQELKEAVTSRTKLIALCNPNNPTGAVMDEDLMREVAKIAGSIGAWILSDEAYLGAELQGDTSATYWGWYDKLVVTGGLSKAYGLPGLRIGWVISNNETVEELWSYKDYISISHSALSDQLAQLALAPTKRTKILERTRTKLNHQLPLVQAFFERHHNHMSWVPPKAGAIAYLKYTWDISSTELMTQLRERSGVLIVPGDHFKMGQYLRIGYGYNEQKLSEGLKRCSSLLETLS